MKRPTINDVARRAMVTPAAVSFALNGQPGVSEQTRRRVLEIARELDYRPNRAARSLSSGKAEALGLVIDRPARSIGTEPFFMQLIAGIQSRLSTDPSGVGLLLRMAETVEAENAIYRDWWASGHVDGVFIVNVHENDARWAELEELNMPAVILGSAQGTRLTTISSDETPFVRELLSHLRELGHRHVARVSGPIELTHTVLRSKAYELLAAELGVELHTVVGDYGREDGARLTHQLLESADPPTAIVYDNDIMALAGLAMARQLDIRVPQQLSIVAWDDSMLCELAQPAVSALHRDVAAFGEFAASSLLAITRGDEVEGQFIEDRTLVVRDSTAPAPQKGFRP